MSQTPQNIQNEGVRENDFDLKTTLVNTDRIRITTANDNYNMTWDTFKEVSGWNAKEQRIQSLEQEIDNLIDGINGLAWTDYEELTLLNSWTGYLRVRRNAMDMVFIYGEITPGVTTRGTTIANVPSAYRPGRVSALPAQSSGINIGAINGLAIVTSGNINIYGAASEDIGTLEVRINYMYRV